MDDDDETNEVVRIVLGAVTLRQRTLVRRDCLSNWSHLNPKLLNENCSLKKKSVNYDSIRRCLNGVTMKIASQAVWADVITSTNFLSWVNSQTVCPH